MQKAWEDILLEMDSKLFNFAELKQTSHFNYLNSSSFQLLFPKWQKGTVRNLWKKIHFLTTKQLEDILTN